MACSYMRNCSDYKNQTDTYKANFCNDSIRCKTCGYYPCATQEMKNNTMKFQKKESNSSAIIALVFIGAIVYFFLWAGGII